MSSPLISVTDLADTLGNGGARVSLLDVRYRMGAPPGLAEFALGHLPGAAYVDLDGDLAASPGVNGRHPLPRPHDFEAAMRAAGVDDDRPVVVYDDWGARAAARCWWLLRHHGHRHVRVLDGGWSAWQAAGHPVETGPPRPTSGGFTLSGSGLEVLTVDEVPSWPGVLLDARAPERFRGEVEPVDPVAGHIPGARNLPTERNLRPDGTFREAAELVALYPAGKVAAYCGSGVTATHALLALAVAGRDGVLYPGSWSEWVAERGRPVETGP